jgi:thioredoxin 1
MASDKIRTFTDSNFDEQTRSGVVLVDFWAPWCGPCRMIAPAVEAIADQFEGRVTVAKMNIDDNPDTPTRLLIRGIPTLLLYKNGQIAETIVGLRPKDDLVRIIERHL